MHSKHSKTPETLHDQGKFQTFVRSEDCRTLGQCVCWARTGRGLQKKSPARINFVILQKNYKINCFVELFCNTFGRNGKFCVHKRKVLVSVPHNNFQCCGCKAGLTPEALLSIATIQFVLYHIAKKQHKVKKSQLKFYPLT